MDQGTAVATNVLNPLSMMPGFGGFVLIRGWHQHVYGRAGIRAKTPGDGLMANACCKTKLKVFGKSSEIGGYIADRVFVAGASA